MRLWFWLHTLDLLAWCGLYGSRAYYSALRRASDATDWGEGCDCGEGEPF